MNRNFAPVLEGAQIRGTGMKHPRVPKVYIGSELNGYVQGDLMDANAISQYITEKTRDIYEQFSEHLTDYGEANTTIADIQTELQNINSSIEQITAGIDNNNEEHLQDLQTILQRLLALEEALSTFSHPVVDGDNVIFS